MEKNRHQKLKKKTDKETLRKKFDTMLDKIVSEIESLETYDTDISIQMENFVQQNFETHMGKKIKEKQKRSVSSRGEKTIIFPCSDLKEYKKNSFRS